MIIKNNSTKIWIYSHLKDRWKESEIITVNEVEKQILRLSMQRKKEKEICDEIFRSKDGLKSIKKKLFQKMDVNNINDAISYAVSFGLI